MERAEPDTERVSRTSQRQQGGPERGAKGAAAVRFLRNFSRPVPMGQVKAPGRSCPRRIAQERSMSSSDFELWLKEATELRAANPLRVPYDVALREAAQAAMFTEKYWEPADGRPHLSRVKTRLPVRIASEIRSLIIATQEAQTRLLLLVDPVVLDVGERARFVVGELESALTFLLDDDVHEAADDQLAQIRAFHADDGQRSVALAQSLRDYAALAQELESRLREADSEFDPRLIGEARELADRLLEERGPKQSDDTAAAMRTRNGMLTLLFDRVTAVRKTAAHIFRAHPDILREVTSAFERRRRMAARRASRRGEVAGDSVGAPGG
jgi:hypothetical protein